MKVAVNLAYCQQHHKGGDNIGTLPGVLHAEWLEAAVQFYYSELSRTMHTVQVPDLFVSITGFPGWPSIEAGRERDALWRAFGRARFVTMAENPGHQVGAAWCIRLGLEAAGKLGYDVMIHTAEDVVPGPGVLAQMAARIAEGHDYAGEAWGERQNELNCQFFACRPATLGAVWDPPAVRGAGHVERYLAQVLEGKRVCRERYEYAHTHDYLDWTRRTKEIRP